MNVNGTVSFLADGSRVQNAPAAAPVSNVQGVDLDGTREFGTRIRVDATGTTGDEVLQVQIDGQRVADFTLGASGTEQVLLFETSEIVDISRVRFVFLNDGIDPDTGVDPVSYTHLTLPTICSV